MLQSSLPCRAEDCILRDTGLGAIYRLGMTAYIHADTASAHLFPFAAATFLRYSPISLLTISSLARPTIIDRLLMGMLCNEQLFDGAVEDGASSIARAARKTDAGIMPDNEVGYGHDRMIVVRRIRTGEVC
ncbi:hypothetical protein DDE84_02975 [Bifidobacterium tibiigranuli]|uniref:Uncharacterized protein n=1 Tax=Bifidobacterium tibiigranuli TaxID=2172043 RepID=A0A5N6RY66_9BIFI|nr:hypothetical protein DDF78_09195 [Bifidobacterium tibiigranuli]KAE8129769.1 hypothetical protein DDE84_02975 [Bifidobacterium tibiigranuli]